MTTKKKSKRTGREIVVAKPIRFSMPHNYGNKPKRNPARWVIAYTAVLALIILGAVGGTFYLTYQPAATVPYLPILTITPTATPVEKYIEKTVIVIVTATPLPPAKKVSENGKKFIAFFEGDSLTAYFDIGMHCTIGTGHRVDPIYCLGELKVSVDQSREWFEQDIRNTERHLAEKLGGVRLNQCQFDALASFHFNLGSYYFDHSGMIETLQEGNLTAIPDIFAKFVYSEGKGPIRGMSLRRAAEARLFSECDYQE